MSKTLSILLGFASLTYFSEIVKILLGQQPSKFALIVACFITGSTGAEWAIKEWKSR